MSDIKYIETNEIEIVCDICKKHIGYLKLHESIPVPPPYYITKAQVDGGHPQIFICKNCKNNEIEGTSTQ